MNFEQWWEITGSAMAPLEKEDLEEHANRVAKAAWKEAAEQAAMECLAVRDDCSQHPNQNFMAETCAQAIRERLLDRKQ
jgi:hypothetical protein